MDIIENAFFAILSVAIFIGCIAAVFAYSAIDGNAKDRGL